MKAHRVCFLIYPGVASYDVAGPAQAFAAAGNARYVVTVASVSGGIVESDCPGLSFASVGATDLHGTFDTLIIPGGTNAPTAAKDPVLVETFKRLSDRTKRVASVCTGAFIAAEAGLLEGRRVATHWRYCDLFAERYTNITLDRDSIWVQDDKFWSSAGVSAGVDLALALIERDQSVAVALGVARELVVFLKRPGGQSQFSTVLSGQIADAGGPFESLFAWVADNLGGDLRAEVLAERAHMSPRTFARACLARIGTTPAKAVEAMRVQAARESIESSDTPLSAIAIRYGFGDEQRMRRAFQRQSHITPSQIRARFRP
ncbi:GlxA family transcriptional regulator [Caballeronia insecticola]|uniref:Transcriptional regulator AraC family with amidase-like domain n=1 Tax=Caballeronia insecticola TaxID=758793 RepID=R4X5G4_9BURK|nr:DJ-1/PfpI family protein [Caballeronia insecticola]BAN28187.1 transcriptional regulator AraC family with amidase-like domain [Caballeronia insecticola]